MSVTMKRFLALACLLPLALHAHTLPSGDKEALRAHILEEFMQKSGAVKTPKIKPKETPVPKTLKKPVTVAGLSAFDLSSFLTASATVPPAGNGALMQASFAPFMPKVRFNWDGTTFFIESDNMPNGMPNRMVGITTWQQQVPIPTAYFASVTNSENNAASLGFGQPNYWRIPLVPVVAPSPTEIYNPPTAPTNFLRGAVALGSNGVAIFNPANNVGHVSYEIGELDYYGGHSGMADDYHYHIIPMHLSARFGGPLSDDKPVAWALDGYPIYGYVEPDGSARQALDSLGGHDHGGWGYHYHAIGTNTVDATHPYGTPQSPYMMKFFKGTVVNFGNQVDGQAEVSSLRQDNTGGYNAKAVPGASIIAMLNPVALTTDGNGHYVQNTSPSAVPSPDAWIMRVNFSGTVLDECWTINRKVNPRTLTMTWRMPSTTMAGVVSATQFKLSAPATGTGSGLTLTAGGTITLTNCSTTAGSTTVNCDSTAGLNFNHVITGPNVPVQPVNTTTYTPTAGSTSHARLTPYPMGAWSEVGIPDTSQVVSSTATFGEDSDYTTSPAAKPQSFTDNGNGTITDNVTGLMWQKTDAGEMTWESAINNASSQTTGGYSDWRLPNPQEIFSIFNHENNNPALNTTYFPSHPSGAAEYWWTRDAFGNSTTNVWCVNSGGGAGGKPKAETLSAGGAFRYHARYVRGAQNNLGHSYTNNGDGTITDCDTSLMWTQLPGPATNWEGALTYAESLTAGGYNDWRLPNIKELQTLTDYSLATVNGGTATNNKPCINRTMFAKTLTNVTTTSGSTTVTCADTTGMVAGMVLVDPFSVAGAYISNTTAPTVVSVVNGTTFTMSANAVSSGSGLKFRALPVATAYWSSTSLKGNTTEAWLLELGVNNAVTPPRGSQGIISYQAKTASFPVFAVRSVSSGSVTQGLATTTTSNLFPPGQRVSAVGTITATDNTTWTVPAATLYTGAPKAPDLYNEYNSVTPADLAAAQAAIAALPTKVIDPDGEVVTGYIFADNYFELYVNGTLVGVDPVPFTSFNSCVVKFKAKRPINYAVRLVDWEENLGLGTELNGADPHHIGDGGFIASFSDGTVTGSDWKAQTFYIAPLDDPNQVVELANGTRSSASATHTLTTTAFAMHYPLPGGWFASGFSTLGWPAATTYSEAQVGVNFPAYMNFQPQFTGSGAQFIWSSSLTLDNEVILRYTGPATTPTQIVVEQPAGTSLADGASTVAYGSVNVGSTLTKTFTIRNNGSTALSITGVTVDGLNAANFSVTAAPASSIAVGATTTMDVRFDASSGGAKTAALHIACSDPAVGTAYDIELTGTGLVPPPTISNIAINPISPSATDNTTVTAQVTPGSGGTISGVSLQYDLGAQVTANVFRETFSMSSSNNWNGSGGLNTWTTNGAGATRQANLQSNRTSPVVLTNCTTTSATTTVVCGSTANLWPNMIITGPGMAAGAVISSITNGTTFVISAAATASSTTATLTANGITLTNCTTTAASTTVTCDSTVGLVAGMGLTGTGLANNATVSSITNATTFVMSAAPTTPGTALTLTGNGNALEFQAASASLTTAMATSPVINAAGTSGYVDFYVQTRDLNSLSPNNQWAFQVSPDNGTTWNTRLTEDWTGSTVTLTNVVTNAAGSGTGSTTVTCASTAGLTTGRAVSAAPVYVTGGTTSGSATVTCTNTTGLAVGMFVTSTGTTIPANARITAINPNVDFTMSANAAATSATAAIAGNYFPANASVSSITNGTTLVLNAAAYVNTSAAPITAFATTINHNFNTKADGTAQPYRYTLDASERTANMRMRFQYAGGTVTQPTRAPRVSIDDIVVNTTSGAPPTVIAMTDLGGGLWSATIPPQANGATVNFTIAATGTGGAGTTTSSTTSYTVAPAPTITTASPLPNGSTTGAYSQTFAATGGSGTGYVWSLFSGSLPNGITLSSGGVLSGTPTQAGNFNFTIEVTDSANRSATKAFALTITTVTAPNVVVIITDDQGWGDVGYHTPAGQVPIQTPNMDSFGTTRPGSIRLERFYATTVCSVTRSTMLTGRNPIRHATNNTRGTDLSEHLMPQTFKAAGYQTFMCGKWHMGGSDKNLHHTLVNGVNTRIIQEGLQYAPFNRGFDSHYGQYSGAIDYYTHNSAEADSLDIPDWWLNGVQQDGPSEHTDSQGTGGWSPNLLADKAIAHIQNRNPSQPFYLHLAFNSIHGPVSAPANLITKYQNLGVTSTSRRLISAAVDGMDQAMGRVLNALDAAGVTNNTVILWFGDNGGDETKGSLNDPLRGDKGDSYDGGLREVAGISYPGVLPSGIISHQYMWVGDVFPTLCAAVGVTPQNTKPFDGLNVWPNLLAATNSTETTLRPGNATLVTDAAAPIAINKFTDPVNGGTKDFKLRRGRVANVITPELFNLTDDPQETTDLIANPAYASIVTSLTNSVTAISAENFKPYIGPPLITNAAAQGSTIELYAPFTSYPNGTITVQWRKNGSNLSNGGNVSGATSFTQVTDNASAIVRGAYTTKLTLTNVQPSDAATYDVVITNTAGNTTSSSGVLTVTMPAPALTLPAFTKGTSITLNWTAVPGATGYTIQRSTTSDFASVTSQTTSSTSVTFSGLSSGTTYYYRGTATDGTNTSAFGNTASSTQDAGTPVVTITAPANNTTTTANSIVVNGTATDTISPLTGLTVNGVAATTSDGYATWTATVPLTPGANTLTATSTDSADQGGNTGSASINVTYNANGPTIVSVSTGPTSPTYLDPTTVLAQITPQPGTTLTSVQLQYDTGTPVSTAIWKETFNNTSSNNWNGTGALNAWSTVGAGNVRQAVSTSNRTAISLTSVATTSGSTTVTCASTAALWPGMLITGPNIAGSINGTQAGNTTVASITNATTFVLSQAATGTSTGLTLTACGVTLTNATTTAASTAVTCDSTAGLVNGMSLTGTGLANNATVASVTSATTFSMNAAPTTAGTALTLSATTAAAEFNGGTADPLASMFTTTNAINTTGASGFIEFYVQTRDLFATNNCGWTLQVSPDNGATWNTRLSEDWNAETVSLSNVVLNAAGAVAGSTTVTCASTAGLTTGRSVLAAPVNATIGITTGSSTATCTNTTGLVEGMFITATGIPNNTRIGTITPNTSFTLVTGTTATLVNATATNAAANAAANYFAGAATVSSITNATTFVLSTAAYANTSAAPLATAFATTVNHGFQLFHYDLAGAELGTQTKIRFQATGYTPTAPTRTPRISIDDIVIATTAPPPTITLAMFDDGLHGDGAANDGVWGAVIPAQNGGTTINFKVVATDNTSASATSPGSGNYIYTVNNLLTDANVTRAEFLGIPTNNSIVLNVGFGADQDAYVEYGTVSGAYASATPVLNYPSASGPAEITLTGLAANTKYYYRLRHRPAGSGPYLARGERSFRTARPRGAPFVFTVTADPHLDETTSVELFDRTMSNIRHDSPDLHIDLGDIFMTDKLSTTDPNLGGGFLSQSRVLNRAMMLRNLFEPACHSVPFFYTLGNHEAEYGYLFNAAADKASNIPAWNLNARKTWYPTPIPSSFYTGNATPKDYPGGSLGLLEDYYAWEWGDALFIVLDPYWNTNANPNAGAGNNWEWSLGTEQYQWLTQTLQNSGAAYKFVFLHNLVGGTDSGRGGVEVAHMYEWGGKNADGVTDGFAANRPGWAMPIHQLLVQNHVNVVFHGHDHFYGHQQLDGIVYLECPQPGTPNFTSFGSAAEGLYTTGTIMPNSGHIRVSVSPTEAIASYVRAYRASDESTLRTNGEIGHQFTLTPSVGGPEIRVFDGTLASGSDLTDGSAEMAFGSVTVGNTSTKLVTIHNHGYSPLAISSVTATGDFGVNLVGMNTTVAGLSSTTFAVNFIPTTPGTRTGSLVITSDDADEASFEIGLTGNGGLVQTISFDPIADQLCGDTLLLSASSSSGLPVSFEVTSGSERALLNAGALIFVGVGEVTLRAVQQGDMTYGAAVPVARTFNVAKGIQLLAFSSPVPVSIHHAETVELVATSSRGLTPVGFEIISGPGVLNGSTLHFSSPGAVAVRAFQAGNDCYLPATVEKTITALGDTAITALDGNARGVMNDLITGQLIVEDTNPIGPLSYELVTAPVHGTVAIDAASGGYSYRPTPGYLGVDHFRYQVSRGSEISNAATVSIVVETALPEWTWMAGASSSNAKGVYGSVGAASMGNVPGARDKASSWTDSEGRFYVFGGSGYGASSGPGLLADLMRYDPATLFWVHLKGAKEINALPVYGSPGVENAASTPGARSGAVSWQDSGGDLWLFGGYGYDSNGAKGVLSDLWRYRPGSNAWTFIAGSSVANQNSVHVTPAMPDVANNPGGRSGAASWTDSTGKFWLFGGRGLSTSGTAVQALNDLWCFDPVTHEWAYMPVSSAPSPRSEAAFWTSKQGEFFLFGGVGSSATIYFSDLWKYSIASNTWQWIAGPSAARQPGVYGTLGFPAVTNRPGARAGATPWVDAEGDLWLFGGSGFGSSTTAGLLNDVWRYDITSNLWTWMKGLSRTGGVGVYGSLYSSAPANTPGSRGRAVAYLSLNGDAYVFGGSNGVKFYNDLWKLDLERKPTVSPLSFAPQTGAAPGFAAVQFSTMVRSQGLKTTVFLRISRAADMSSSVTTAPQSIGDGDEPVAFEVSQTQLLPGTSYFAQVVATNAAGSGQSAVRHLLTSGDVDAPELGFANSGTSIAEASQANGTPVAGAAKVLVRLTQPLTQSVSVPLNYAGTAVAGVDYGIVPSVLNLMPGQSEVTLTIPLLNDVLSESPESLGITLGTPSSGAVLGTPTQFTLTITDDDLGPVIGTPPQSQILAAGGPPVTLGVQGLVGTPPFTYQWLKNGVPLPSARSATLLLPSSDSSIGFYEVIVTNPTGSTLSDRARISLLQVTDSVISLPIGARHTLTASVSSRAPVTYEWRKITDTGFTVLSSTTGTQTLNNLSLADSGIYYCRVTTGGASRNTGFTTLSVVSFKPEILPIEQLPPGAVGAPYSHRVAIHPDSLKAATSFTATGLPSGLRIDSTGLISGRPTAAVITKAVSIVARNAFGASTTELCNITISALPTTLPGVYVAEGTLDGDSARLDVTVTTTGASTVKYTDLNGSTSGTGNLIATQDNSGPAPITRWEATLFLSPKMKPLLTLNAVFISNQPNEMSGVILERTTSRVMGTIDGYRRVWTSTNPAGSYAGSYTSLLKTPSPLIGDQDIPQGTGMATWGIAASTGTSSITGKTSLGLSYSVSSFVSAQGETFTYAPSLATQSTLSGWSVITPSNGDNFVRNTLGGQWSWKKAVAPTTSVSRLYRRGFPVHTLVVEGGKYSPPAAGSIIMGLDVPPPDNARLDFAQGGLITGDIGPFQFGITNPSGALQKVTVPVAGGPFNPNKISFSLLATKGIFTGSFSIAHPVSTLLRKVTYTGIIVRGAAGFQSEGYFLMPQLPQPGQSLLTSPVLSGHVALSPAQ